MEKIEKKILVARAKKLYFEKNPNIKEVYVDVYGRFSFNKGNLLEVNKVKKDEVFLIKRNATTGVKTGDVEVFDNKETKNKHFPNPKKVVTEKH